VRRSAEATDPDEGIPAGVRACPRCLMQGVAGTTTRATSSSTCWQPGMQGSGVNPPKDSARNEAAVTTIQATSSSTCWQPDMSGFRPPVGFSTTKTGKKFHLQKECSGLRNAKSIFEVSQRPEDLMPCELCAGIGSYLKG
jgi:hypothetical protein